MKVLITVAKREAIIHALLSGGVDAVGVKPSHILCENAYIRQTCTFTASGFTFASFNATARAISSRVPMKAPMPFQPA